jgi:hypothetical protein
MTYKNRKARRAFARSTGHQKTAQGGHPAPMDHTTFLRTRGGRRDA